MRIAVHDYAGHPFQFELSRQLAREGHVVRHFYFAGDSGPKGDASVRADDGPGFSVGAVNLPGVYSKSKLFQRRAMDIRYGREAGARIAAFQPDVVISGNTPVEAQGPLMRAAQGAGAAFVFWMQDFYSLAVKRILGRKWFGAGAAIAAWYEHLEAGQLRASDGVVLISDDFLSGLAELKVQPKSLEIIPNWGALGSLPVRPKANPWARNHGLEDRFVFLYSGTLGLKHDPLVLTALADAFAETERVQVTVVAAGQGADMLKGELAARPRRNIDLLPLQSMEALPDVLGCADVVIALLEEDAGRFSVPSKVLSYLCANRPIVLSAPRENLAARILTDAGAGLVVEAGDAGGLIAAARRLHGDSQLRASFGASGRAYAEANFDIGAVAQRFMGVFEKAVAQRRSRA
ncbi:glycosyltransferase family 4 protein [Phenylobacterium sp.]|uniref:glycosyltransferase family 4 protein n=1 Tax=Phenylobacterium sp. TaxID=1871053 RepID=UPI0035C83CB1